MTSLTTSHPTNTTTVTTPELTPRQGRPGITARWTRWVLVGTVSVGLVGAAAGLGYRTYERSHPTAAAAGTAQSSVAASRVDAAESAHGSGSGIRAGVDASVSGTGASATQATASTASPIASGGGLPLHGTRGSLEDATGQPVGTR